ncbi:HAD family hydrolase [Fusobacterium sp. MFO224]|uniref:HAD family hydrolase n=1 Tax=Fusobacterium sp. MFO224 TaxID=3378070 RepID=UPI003851C603
MKEKNIKLIVTDLDGTFVNKSKEVTETNRKVVNELIERGLEFVVASGRDYTSIKDLTRDIKNIKYHICLNGAKIYKNDEIIYKKTVDREICFDILTKATEMDINYSGTAGKDVCYSQLDTEYYKEFSLEERNFNFISNEDKKEIVARDFEKMVFYGELDHLKNLREYVEEKYSSEVNVFISGDRIMDIVNKESNKGNALKIVSADCGISLDHVIAFGDNENDLPMLEEAGLAVIVENAKKILKNRIDEVTDSNEESGVGNYLNKYFKL